MSARSLTADGAFVAVLQDDTLVVSAASGLPLTAGAPAPWPDAVLRVIDSALPVVFAGNAPRANLDSLADIRSLAAVPLVAITNGPPGALCVVSRADRQWSPAEIDLLTELAGSAIRESELISAVKSADRHSAERSAIVDGAAIGICGVDVNGAITFMNRSGADLLGYAVDDLRGVPLSALHPAHAVASDWGARETDPGSTADGAPHAAGDQVLDAARIMQADVPLRSGTAVLRRSDGKTLPVEFSASVVHERGEVAGAVIMFMDLSERRLAEAGMRESEERYRRLVELLPDALALVLNGRISFVNPAAVRLTESSSASEMVGRRITDFLPADVRDRVDRLLHRREHRSGSISLETALVRADGSLVPVDISAIPLVIRGQQGVQVVVRDLSERRAAAAALHRSEEQLRHSQKMEAIGRLAGGVAHDFNNILTAIRGFATLLDQDGDADDLRSLYVQEILKASDRAASLTRQLLAFGRRQVLNPVVLDVNASIRDMSKLIQRLIGEDVELALVLRPDAGRVMADPGQIEQVIMNLVVNARDAMESSGRLTIETHNTFLDETYSQGRFAFKPGSYVLVAVSDTGTGMDPATLERAFEPFFTTKPANRGTGLGLSTVYGIVKQSGGFVWAYSEPGQGTTMKVYLPRVDADACAVPEPESPALRPGGSETILLVEDEPAVRLLTRTLLVQHGYNVVEAPNGETALQIAATHDAPIHLLLTDVVMPRMGGRELADRLLQQRPDIRVVYVSGYAEHAIARHGILEEGCILLQKPFTPDALLAVVQTALATPD